MLPAPGDASIITGLVAATGREGFTPNPPGTTE